MLFSYISFLIASPNLRIQTHSGGPWCMAGAEQLQVPSLGQWSSCVADGFWMADANWGMLGACWAFRRWRFGSWRHWLTAVATKPVVVLWEMAGIPCTLQAPNLRDRSGIQEHTADLNRGTCRSVAGGRAYLAANDPKFHGDFQTPATAYSGMQWLSYYSSFIINDLYQTILLSLTIYSPTG